MTFADDSKFVSFIRKDHYLPMVTAESMGDLLLDFPLAPHPDLKLGWIAMAVRRSLAASMRNLSNGHTRKSNAEIEIELNKLAEKAGKTWVALSDRSSEADTQLWKHAFKHWRGVNAIAADADPNFAYNEFQDAMAGLERLTSFLSSAAHETTKQQKKWRQAEQRAERIDRARCLAPVFEKTFGQPVSANNWSSPWAGDALAKAPTPFMVFYQQIARLAFDEPATPDLPGVTKEACRLHRQEPLSFEGSISGM